MLTIRKLTASHRLSIHLISFRIYGLHIFIIAIKKRFSIGEKICLHIISVLSL